VLKLTGENVQPIIERWLQTFFLEANIDPSASGIVVNQIVAGVERWGEQLQTFAEALSEMVFPVDQIEANVSADEVFYACANQIDLLLPHCNDPSEEQPACGYLDLSCPVTLKDKHLLYVGSDITLFFDGEQFAFTDESAQERCRNATLVFLNPLSLVPPPLILILGARGSGGTSIAPEIGRTHQAPVYDFPDNPKFLPVREEEGPDLEEVDPKNS
jgi:hypothetical protein